MNSKIFLKIFFKLTGFLLVYHVFQLCFYEVSVCVCMCIHFSCSLFPFYVS